MPLGFDCSVPSKSVRVQREYVLSNRPETNPGLFQGVYVFGSSLCSKQ